MDIKNTPSPLGHSTPALTAGSSKATKAQETLGGRSVAHSKGSLPKQAFQAFRAFAQSIAAHLSDLLRNLSPQSPGVGKGKGTAQATLEEPSVPSFSIPAYHETKKDLVATLPGFKTNVEEGFRGYAVGGNPAAGLPDKFEAVAKDCNRAQFIFIGSQTTAVTDRNALNQLDVSARPASMERLIQECFGKERTDPTLQVALNLTNQNVFGDIQTQQMFANNLVMASQDSPMEVKYQLTQGGDGSYTLTATTTTEHLQKAMILHRDNLEMNIVPCDPSKSHYALEVSVRISPETTPGQGPQIELLSCTRTFHREPVAHPGGEA